MTAPIRRGQLVYRGPHVSVRFRLNRIGVQRVALSNDVGDACESWARFVAMPFAISISPRSRRQNKQHYYQSFEVHGILIGAPPSSHIIGRPPMMRRGAILLNSAPYAAAVEWGGRRRTERQTSHRVLGKTLARFRRPVRRRR